MSAEILVVEDNPLNLKLVRVLLEGEGYLVTGARDAVEATARLREQVPELILMDLALPGLDGFTLTRQLRADPRTHNVPIVALTAYAMKGDEQRALASGCSAYLAKPLKVDAFLAVVSRLINGDGPPHAGGAETSSSPGLPAGAVP
ncbi:MAG TPA: response regulator [Thermoplasmata archaeon]|nr:response regulator [Thermoplasmata archaeon]